MAQVVVVLVTDRRKLASEVVVMCGDDVKLGYSGRHESEEQKTLEKRDKLKEECCRQRRKGGKRREREVGLGLLLGGVEQGTGGCDKRRRCRCGEKQCARALSSRIRDDSRQERRLQLRREGKRRQVRCWKGEKRDGSPPVDEKRLRKGERRKSTERRAKNERRARPTYSPTIALVQAGCPPHLYGGAQSACRPQLQHTLADSMALVRLQPGK
jgi:hypothetical protein